jgi:sugar phosphate permease
VKLLACLANHSLQGNLISNAFGSLIAAGVLNNMEGVGGHAAWRWLFFIEGALTMGVAVIAAVMLPDTLENSRGFSREELAVARLRMLEDAGEIDADGKDEPWYHGLRLCLTDYKIYILMLSLIAVVTGLVSVLLVTRPVRID